MLQEEILHDVFFNKILQEETALREIASRRDRSRKVLQEEILQKEIVWEILLNIETNIIR